jgi:hypothetical protein
LIPKKGGEMGGDRGTLRDMTLELNGAFSLPHFDYMSGLAVERTYLDTEVALSSSIEQVSLDSGWEHCWGSDHDHAASLALELDGADS